MKGKSSNFKPGGVVLEGPAKLKGEALFVKCGSVNILIPSICSKKVECPIHVIVFSDLLDFKYL